MLHFILTLDNPRLKADKYSCKTSLETSCPHVSKRESSRECRPPGEHRQAPAGVNVSAVHPFLLSSSPVAAAMSASVGRPTASDTRVCQTQCGSSLLCSKRTASLPHCSLLPLSSPGHHRQTVFTLSLQSYSFCFSFLCSLFSPLSVGKALLLTGRILRNNFLFLVS